MIADKQSINDMKNLIALIQDSGDETKSRKKANVVYDKAPENQPTIITNNTELFSNAPDKQSIASMKKVLESFHRATESASKELINESTHNTILERNLYAEKTTSGVKFNDYEIVTESLDSGLKIYSLNKKGYPVVENLRTYESALLVLDFLKKGKKLTEDCIKSVIDLDEMYNRNINDAVRFKKRSRLCENKGEYDQSDIWMSRFDLAKKNADLAKLKLRELSLDIL